ncbi:serine protease 1-like isoform X2 [Malaya genurostris]|uniref:serine protease 1-like isoform X2 n=1 Tax=Malaya genurostris TaxID=325434 RepID=UPI0026F3DB16|nr:serine protease 1-like isoform X2 [Malaya genurostris]
MSDGNYFVLLFVSLIGENEGGQFCTGSVVGSQWIITEASCVWKKLSSEFSVGIAPQNNESVGWYHEKANKIYIHPNYNSSVPLQSNVALLRLRKAISRFAPIEIDHDQSYPEGPLKCLLADWDRYRSPETRIQYLEIASTKDRLCESSQSQCGLEFGKNICEFHNGSPLICQRNNAFGLMAILTERKQCSNLSLNAFLDLRPQADWINGVVHGNTDYINAQKVNYSMRLSQFNWMIVAVTFFILSVTIFIKILKSGFEIR